MNKGFNPVNLALRAATAALIAAGVAFAPAAHADSKQGTVNTEIVRTGSLSNTRSLDFGFITPGTATSYLTIPATSNSISVTGGNAIPTGGTISRAQFSATTLPINFITVQLPSTATLTRQGGTETITLDQFTHDLTGGITIPFIGTGYNVLNNGTLVFNVGARIRINPSQAHGKYTGTYPVTANFY